MSLEKAREAIRARAGQQRAERVQRAILSNAVGDLAASAAKPLVKPTDLFLSRWESQTQTTA